MLILGGRLADLVSRKRVGVPLRGASTLAYAGFYLASGPLIWPLALAGAMLGSAGGAALAPYASELFATRIRSEAQTLTLVMGVTGSAVGLATVALLSGSLGLGPSIALLAVLPFAGLVIVARAFPETARRELEETSASRCPRTRRPEPTHEPSTVCQIAAASSLPREDGRGRTSRELWIRTAATGIGGPRYPNREGAMMRRPGEP